ncbi:MAG: class I adenylate-forming enzyme family protein [Gemmobacter sp.]|nr:class I adenylate-forming enzyme family protein [Gemmobacter sp.]
MSTSNAETTGHWKSLAQRRAIIEQANGPWKKRTLAGTLDHAAERHGDSPFVIAEDRVWTYSEIREESRRLAARLLAHGVRPRDHVAIILGNQVEFTIAKFAVARLGAVAVSVNFMLRQAEIGYILQQADCVALIVMNMFRDHDYLADLDALMPRWETGAGGGGYPCLRRVFVVPVEAPLRPGSLPLIDAAWSPSAADLAMLTEAEAKADPDFRCDVLYTSGTTGHPKGAMITHDMILRIAYASTYTLAREPGRRVLFALPMYHVFGYVECLVAMMFIGGAIVPRIRFDALDMVEAAERHQVGEICCVPLMTQAMLDVVRTRGFNCPSLVAFFNSGGVNPPTIWQDIRDHFGARELMSGYGMTECSASTCCAISEGDDNVLRNSNGRLKLAGLAAVPGDGAHLVIYKTIDPETGADLAPGEKGELMARGYCVTKGYYNKPEETARAFTPDGWFHTGDVGTMDADGYVRLMGRIKEAYRCGGEMVMPEEVENFLKTHPDIENVIVVGVPDARMGEVGCALVVGRGRTPDQKDLTEFCQNRIARFKIPKYVIPVAAADLPFTVTGRARRVQLASDARRRLNL